MSVEGWAIKKDGELIVRSVGDTKRMAMVNCFWLFGINAENDWTDKTVETVFNSFVKSNPGLECVKIKIEEIKEA